MGPNNRKYHWIKYPITAYTIITGVWLFITPFNLLVIIAFYIGMIGVFAHHRPVSWLSKRLQFWGLLTLGAIHAIGMTAGVWFVAVFIALFSGHLSNAKNSTQTQKEQEREARIAAANQKSPCEQALASYDPKRWHYTQSSDGPRSKWRSVDCATYSCSGYTGVKKDRVLQRSFGRVYNFLKTDEPNNSCSTNVHQFTCKFDRPKVELLLLNRDINQVLKNIGVPEISGQLKIGLSLDRSRTYEYYYDNGHNIYIYVEDSWNKDCSYITSIIYNHYEYKE